MTCKDCIHYECCKEYLTKCAEHGEAERINNPCTKFKNKADYVEVVECSNCKYARFNRFSCAYSCKRRNYYSEFVRPTDFCSYGERKDT